jgi:hypothetical protein
MEGDLGICQENDALDTAFLNLVMQSVSYLSFSHMKIKYTRLMVSNFGTTNGERF